MRVSFHFHHPKDAGARNRPQKGQRSVDRHKECPSLWVHCSWGCFIICKIMVSFDAAQDREPVERPFHDLWIHGGETEKRPSCPPCCIESAQNYGSNFWDTTPEEAEFSIFPFRDVLTISWDPFLLTHSAKRAYIHIPT
jgi:hypothetical protein